MDTVETAEKPAKKPRKPRTTKAEVEALKRENEELKANNMRLLTEIGKMTQQYLELLKMKNALERNAVRLPPTTADVFHLMAQILHATGSLPGDAMRKAVADIP